MRSLSLLYRIEALFKLIEGFLRNLNFDTEVRQGNVVYVKLLCFLLILNLHTVNESHVYDCDNESDSDESVANDPVAVIFDPLLLSLVIVLPLVELALRLQEEVSLNAGAGFIVWIIW